VTCSLIEQVPPPAADGSSQQRSDAGFSLMEVVVALALLTFMITGIFYMGTISTGANTRSEDEAAAVALAIDEIEQLKNAGFGSAACPATQPESLGIYSRTCTIGAQYSLAGVPAEDFTVAVQWTGGGSVSLSTTLINPPSMSSGALEQFSTVAVKSWSSQ